MNVVHLEMPVGDVSNAIVTAKEILDAFPQQLGEVSISAILAASIMVGGKNTGTAWICPSALRRRGVVGIAKPNDRGGYDYLICSAPRHETYSGIRIAIERRSYTFADATNWIGCLYHPNDDCLHLSGMLANGEGIRGTIFLPPNNQLGMVPFISGVIGSDLKAIKFGARKLLTDIACHLGGERVVVVSSKWGMFPALRFRGKKVIVKSIGESGAIVGEAVVL